MLRSQPLRADFLLLTLFASLSFSGCGSDAQNTSQAGAPPPPTVQFATVQQKDVSLTSEWIATMDGYVNAQIQPHVSGYLIRQDYREGSVVHKGELLFEIDPRPFQATLDQSKAQLAQAEAQVVQAQAQLAKASKTSLAILHSPKPKQSRKASWMTTSKRRREPRPRSPPRRPLWRQPKRQSNRPN